MHVETPPSLPALISARITYAEDGFENLRTAPGTGAGGPGQSAQAVKAGDVLMVIDAADIAKAYAAMSRKFLRFRAQPNANYD